MKLEIQHLNGDVTYTLVLEEINKFLRITKQTSTSLKKIWWYAFNPCKPRTQLTFPFLHTSQKRFKCKNDTLIPKITPHSTINQKKSIRRLIYSNLIQDYFNIIQDYFNPMHTYIGDRVVNINYYRKFDTNCSHLSKRKKEKVTRSYIIARQLSNIQLVCPFIIGWSLGRSWLTQTMGASNTFTSQI